MFAWDDIAVFLALYRERTTGRAAAALGVSQPTVVRRIATLEHAIGLQLFERTPSGFVPAKAAAKLFEAAQRIERGICEFTSEVDALTGAEFNIIRLTLLDHFEQLMVPLLRAFRERWPGYQAQLLASDRMYDLARGEADIAVRGRERPDDDELVSRDMPACGFALYASALSCPDEIPASREEVGKYPLALLEGPPGQLPIYEWLASVGSSSGKAPLRCGNFRALSSTVASGAVISALPCTMGDADPQLVRCFPPEERFDVPIFLIARRTVLRRPPARDLFDSIANYFNERPSLLTGVRD